MMEPLNHLEYYRLPWNYADNGISWLEPTTDFMRKRLATAISDQEDRS